MAIPTTLGVLVGACDALQAVMALPLPALTSYKISKLAKPIFAEVALYHDRRNATVKRLGTPSADNPDSYEFKDVAAFNAEIADLLAVEVTIDADPISLKSLGDAKIEGKHLAALGPFLIDDVK